MARQYLGCPPCPATSATVERLFSQVGIAFSKKRKSAEAGTIEVRLRISCFRVLICRELDFCLTIARLEKEKRRARAVPCARWRVAARLTLTALTLTAETLMLTLAIGVCKQR